MSKYVVTLAACTDYNPKTVHGIIKNAIAKDPPKTSIQGKIVIKPNLCFTHPKITDESFTHPNVTEGIIMALRDLSQDIDKIDIVEKSGLGVTTANMFRWAGYPRLRRKHNVTLCAMEERRRSRVFLDHGKVHTNITVAREIAERDFLVFAPKLKTNVLSHGLTAALKLNIGTVDSKERIAHHDHNLHVKIVDILEAANPDLIVTDGLSLSFGGNQMTQHCTPFGVIVVATNAVAHDMVCAKLLGLDPFEIDHIKEAMDRGYGPTSMDEIVIQGDFPLEKGKSIVKDLDFGFMPVDQFQSNFNIISGKPYCTGGCQGIFLDWLHMIKDRKPRELNRFPKLTALVGKVDQKIKDKTVLLLGDCAQTSPSIDATRIVRIKGCPPTHKRIIFDMMVKFCLLAPLVRPSLIWDGFVLYPLKRFKGWLLNFRFRPMES